MRDHFETFRAQAASLREGDGLPRFVEQEFRDFLRCGCLAGGFARLRCTACRFERLVPFSCKGRGFCPSCGGRRMAERAAHLVDHVIPPVPVRQWVLTFPRRLRYAMAWDHDLCRAVIGVSLRAVLGFLRHAARDSGVAGGRGGAVAIIQRFGGALNLNVHVHALVLDGVFVPDGAGVRFWPAPALRTADVADVLATIVPRVRRLLARRAPDDEETGEPDGWMEEAPVLAGLAAASVQGRAALGRRAGLPVRRNGAAVGGEDEAQDLGSCHVRQDGFDLHAAVRVGRDRRERLERLCRYALRPPVGQDRLHLTAAGQVVVTFKRAWSDGTTRAVFEPSEVLERLAVLTPRPRINLILYHGVLAPRAAWRRLAVEFRGRAEPAASGDGERRRDGAGLRWAELMRRTFGIDVLACPRCGGRLRLLALIEQASVIARVLSHLGLPTEVPAPRPARAPPLTFADEEGPVPDQMSDPDC